MILYSSCCRILLRNDDDVSLVGDGRDDSNVGRLDDPDGELNDVLAKETSSENNLLARRLSIGRLASNSDGRISKSSNGTGIFVIIKFWSRNLRTSFLFKLSFWLLKER
jgi:hypothetical protein